MLDLERRATALLDAAEADPARADVALRAIREVRGCIELLARVAGTLAPARGEVELAEHPEFPPLLAKITAALTAFPEAAAAVALAFEDEAAA